MSFENGGKIGGTFIKRREGRKLFLKQKSRLHKRLGMTLFTLVLLQYKFAPVDPHQPRFLFATTETPGRQSMINLCTFIGDY